MKGVVLGLALTAVGCANRMPTAERYAEPTGWSLCYEADGTVADYDGHCSDPSLIKWNLPAKVYLPLGYSSRLRFKEAMTVWDTWMGTEAFRLVGSAPEADIVVEDGGEPWGIAGRALHTKTGGTVKFHLEIFDGYYDRPDIIAHELGHTLGLAHDEGDKRSIMYPGMEWYLPALTPVDCDYLKRLYNLRVGCPE